jgi:hypothetical protein
VPRRRRRSVSIFNFSFVDILATTIGVIVFIMVMVLLNVTDTISASGLEDEVEEARERVRQHQRAAAEWDERAAQQADLQDTYAKAASKAAVARQRLNAQRQRNRQLEQEGERLAGELEDLQGAVNGLEERVEGLEERMAQRQDRQREEVAFRIPRERPTTKQPFAFECAGGKVYLVASGGSLNKSSYSITDMGAALLIQRKDSAVGESLAAALRRGSTFQRTLRQADPRKEFAMFVVREDSFGFFRKLRERVIEAGFDYNWEAFQNDRSLISGKGGGGQATVQ